MERVAAVLDANIQQLTWRIVSASNFQILVGNHTFNANIATFWFR